MGLSSHFSCWRFKCPFFQDRTEQPPLFPTLFRVSLLGHLQPGTVKRSCCLQFTEAKRLTCEMLLTQGPAVGTFSGQCSLITQLQIPSVLAQSSCLTTGPGFAPELSTHTCLHSDPGKEVTELQGWIQVSFSTFSIWFSHLVLILWPMVDVPS